MENNVTVLQQSKELVAGARALAGRAAALAERLLSDDPTLAKVERGGRKAHALS
jgi:hypothetical protein